MCENEMQSRNIKSREKMVFTNAVFVLQKKKVFNDHLLTLPGVFENQVKTAFWMVTLFQFS